MTIGGRISGERKSAGNQLRARDSQRDSTRATGTPSSTAVTVALAARAALKRRSNASRRCRRGTWRTSASVNPSGGNLRKAVVVNEVHDDHRSGSRK